MNCRAHPKSQCICLNTRSLASILCVPLLGSLLKRKSGQYYAACQIRLTHKRPRTDRERIQGNRQNSNSSTHYLGLEEEPVEESAYLKYDGPELDSPITVAKVHAVVQSFKKNMAPGRDQIMNAMIRNLNYKTLSQLADFYKTIWANGEVPREWKEAILMPKAGNQEPTKPWTHISDIVHGQTF